MIKRPALSKKVVVNLDGVDGNAYALMAYAKSWCKDLGIDFAPILKDMQASDYRHLVLVLEKTFGAYVDFTTKQKSLLNIDETEIEIEAHMANAGYK